MKENVKIENLLSMISKDYDFIKIENKYCCETKYDLVQIFEIGWDDIKKKYYLVFEITKDNQRITGFEIQTNCFLPIKKHLFNAIIH